MDELMNSPSSYCGPAKRFLDLFPKARWSSYQPLDTWQEASEKSLGKHGRGQPRSRRCRVLVPTISKKVHDRWVMANKGPIPVLWLARTVVEMDKKDQISAAHLAEAIQYRDCRNR